MYFSVELRCSSDSLVYFKRRKTRKTGLRDFLDLTGFASVEDCAEYLRINRNFTADPQYIFVIRNEVGQYLRAFYAHRARVVHIPLLAIGFSELRTALSFAENWQRICDARYLPVRIHHIPQPAISKVEIVSIGRSRRAEQSKPRWQF